MTTVLDEILKAEQAAEVAVAEAKANALAAETAALAHHTEVIQAEHAATVKHAEVALHDFEKELEKIEQNIANTIERDVATIAQQFANKKNELVTLVTRYFA